MKYSKMDNKININRYMARQFESLEWIMSYLKGNSINTIVHGGDMFDSPRFTAYPVQRTRKLLDGFDVYAIKGNHDDNGLLHDNSMSALDLLGINSIDEPMAKVIGGVNFVFIPWGYGIDVSLKRHGMKNVLVAHGFPRDYLGDGEIHDTNGNGAYESVLSSKTLDFDMVITGHYHNIDEFTKKNTVFLNPGSISASGNDDGNQHSIWILDTDTLSYERVKIPNSVRLITVKTDDINGALAAVNTEDIYRIYISSKENIDRKVLFNARRVALDIQLKVSSESASADETEKVDDFWSYVSENSEYSDEFRKILLEENV